MRQWLRDLLIALSWANLCFLNMWSQFLTYTRANTYIMKTPPPPTGYMAVFLNVLLLGGLLWVGITIVRRYLSGRILMLAHSVFLLLLLFPLSALRSTLAPYLPYVSGRWLFGVLGESGVTLLLVICAIMLVLVLLRWPTKLSRMAATVLLMLFPFVPVTYLQGIVAVTHQAPAVFAPKPLAPPLQDAKTTPRMLWIIFDELDQRLVFDERPASIALPEFDRFRRQALSASQAYSPSNKTLTSLPALITGRWVTQAEEVNADKLLVQFVDAPEPVPWSQVPSVFSKARTAGFNTALIGFYHPYCRILSTLTSCWWYDMPMLWNSLRGGLLYTMLDQARSLFETPTLSLFNQSLATMRHAHDHQDFVECAERVATNPVYGLSLLHFGIPHGPHFYDRVTYQPVLGNAPFRGYVNSLVLTDHTLGQLRRAMERAGMWDTTTILISADHSFRSLQALGGKQDHRIPFLLKLSGQDTAVGYELPFNSIITHDLILAILHSELVTPQEVIAWLDQRRMASPETHQTFK
jgi:sulfatase-like protein